MKYWSWLAVKLVLTVGVVGGFLLLAVWLTPPVLPSTQGWMANWPALAWIVLAAAAALGFGLGWLCAADQMLRCRTCARRLRMPVTDGDFSRALLRPAPRTEYICAYGHGKLTVSDVHVSSARTVRWIHYGTLWDNLVTADRQGRGGA